MPAYPVTERIARFATETTLENVPAQAVATAKVAFMDCVGVALAGSTDEAGTLAAEAARAEGAREQASVIGHGFRTSAQQAAFANGVAAHALDYDHSFVAGGQPTAPVIPATLALAESLGADGRRLLEAYVVGFEVTGKISQSLYEVPQHAWHQPSTMGVLGATAACAKLLGLDEAKTRIAVGMAASLTGGLEANFGTMTKPLHVGVAARNAVLASTLAASGYTANPQALEAEVGYFDAYYRHEQQAGGALDELGKRWELVDSGLRIKPYPCGGLAHTAIDAALQVRQQLAGRGLSADDVGSVDVEVTQRTADRIAFGVPGTELEAKFSMPYLVARALLDGRVGLSAFTDAAIAEQAPLAVAGKVTMGVASDLRADKTGRPARVTARLRNGETIVSKVQAAKGGNEVPMTDEELRAKFHECAARVLTPDAAGQVLEQIDGLDRLSELGTLARLLRG